jgi:hypothetical protein
MRTLDLNPSGDTPMVLTLRPLTGTDELTLAGIGAAPALALLDRLADGADVAVLTVTQADRALAGIYLMLYGPQAECQAACESCGESYEFTLDLSQIIAAQDAERPAPPDAGGAWTLPDGTRVRAPTQADLAGDPAGLAARLTVEGEANAGEVGAFLETASPVLTIDMAARCPDCGTAAQVRFDLATYLTRRLAAEHPFLVRETHLIASRYGWSHDEIMALTRDDRRAYAGLIEAERARLSRRQTG